MEDNVVSIITDCNKDENHSEYWMIRHKYTKQEKRIDATISDVKKVQHLSICTQNEQQRLKENENKDILGMYGRCTLSW